MVLKAHSCVTPHSNTAFLVLNPFYCMFMLLNLKNATYYSYVQFQDYGLSSVPVFNWTTFFDLMQVDYHIFENLLRVKSEFKN